MDTQNFDLSNCTRDGLLKVLSTAESEMRKYLNAAEKVEECEKSIETEKNSWSMGCAGLIITFFIIGLSSFGLLISFISLGQGKLSGKFPIPEDVTYTVFIVSLTIIALTLVYIKIKRKRHKKNVQIGIDKLDVQLQNLQKKETESTENFNAILHIPKDYWSPYAMVIMQKFIENKRADTWKEVTALYEDYEHKEEMKENARLQTEIARQTRNASRMAAAGAWATATGVWRR